MGDSERSIKVAVAQAAPVFLDREASTERAVELIQEAGSQGIDLVAFPEGFIPGHPVWYHFHPVTSRESLAMAARLFRNSVEIPGPITERLCSAAAESDVNVVIGVCERRPHTSGTMYNTQVFIDRTGRIAGKHQKIMPTVGEKMVHTGGWGDTMTAFEFDVGRVSGLICGENSNPLAIFALAAQGTQIHVGSWPNHFSKNEHSMSDVVTLAGRSLAYKANCFVLNACSTVSPEMLEVLPQSEDDRIFLENPANSGGSCIIGADARVMAGPMPGDFEGLLVADINLAQCVEAKLVHDYAGHYNRPDIFTLTIDRRVPQYLAELEDGDTAPEEIGSLGSPASPDETAPTRTDKPVGEVTKTPPLSQP
ncbi:MAG: carbon-nitrogen hydrolase family protein [Acidimicrobiia bacterium]|nr:carbon-nitrogen hydrolase family protein [Acidimicrobiia bacterium]